MLGALLGLTCAARVSRARTPGRRGWWLILAAWAIGGTGIWVMHFIAMLGFGVRGTDIRYDIPLTLASAVLAVAVVAIGLSLANLGRPRTIKILAGGLIAGLGVNAMHYTGMAAMHISGTVTYDPLLVAASIVIAVVAATVALYFTVTVRRAGALFGSALLMGVAVCGMHYTGMLAMKVHLHTTVLTDPPPTGATVQALLIPIVVLVIFALVGLFYAVLAPAGDDLPLGPYRPAAAAAAARTPPPGPAPEIRDFFTPTRRR